MAQSKPSMAKRYSNCPNCGNGLKQSDHFCSQCGQENRDLHISFWELLKELLSGIFNFDTKVWVTLKLLLTGPGELSVLFSQGKRAAYVQPLRLYLFVSFFYFLSIGHDPLSDDHQKSNVLFKMSQDGTVLTNEKLASLDTSELKTPWLGTDPNDVAAQDSLARTIGLEPSKNTRLFTRQFIKLMNDRKAFTKEFFSNLSISFFLLMPVFALLIRLFSKTPRPYYIDALVYSIHVHTWLFLFLGVSNLLAFITPISWLNTVVLFGTLMYLFISFRRFHPMSKTAAVLRSFAVLSVYFVVCGISMLAVILASMLLM